ncbi:Outer membrane protein [Ignavibacterium album JCM 16511]|uniref:Outer membrane protein n=1 Tax=Ignavibacterium album (strain DSM 19864 / JCM 16511 / NBRC 101810 / Mat9-16) TaxID=945713 RepID=I0ANJ9_IGNAJ|nr:TolC family protein [Ignavibacterium album]AFH50556.1 Outer membrane protein [Ignavibacterium album JCM 16511]
MKKIFVFLVAFSLSMFGQSNQLTLTMDEAINLALEKNSELKIAKMEVDKSEQKLREARSGLFPKLDLNGQYQRYIDKPVIFLPPGSPLGRTLVIGSDNSYLAAAQLSLPLFALPLYEGIGLASDALAIAEQNYLSVKNKIVGEVKKSFLAVILTRETKDVMKQSLKNAEDNFENIKRLNAAGTLSDYDVLRAEVQVENLKPIVLQMENNYKLSLEALKVTIGLDANQNIDVVGDMEFDESYKLPTEQEVIEELLKNNPQLAILDKQVQLNDRNVSLEQAAYFPSLAGFGNYQYQTQANDFKFSDYNWVKTFVLGLQLQVPIFNGFKTQARVSQAEIGLNQSVEQKRNLTEAIKTQALSVLYRVQQALIRIQGQNKTVRTAQEGYEIAKRRLENNVGTQLEVNDAELALRQAKLNRLQAIYDFKVAEADLETVLGRIK